MNEKKWKDLTFVAFDTETTGQYPLTSEFCEVAAVKWKGGKVIDTFSSLIKPSHIIPEDVIKIHGITNEMVQGEKPFAEKITSLMSFFEDSIVVAHHAAFDVGFLVLELEKYNEELPNHPIICTSYLSRNVIKESPNHRLQTLIRHLKLEQGAAHRALDDAKACLGVALKCFERMGEEATLNEIIARQGKFFDWQRFSFDQLSQNTDLKQLIDLTKAKDAVSFVYSGGSRSGEKRSATPMGIVRSLDGDYFVGFCHHDQKKKRFYLDKISQVERSEEELG